MRTVLLFVFAFLAFPSWAQWNSMKPVVASQTGARSVSIAPGQSVSDLIQGVYVPKSQSLLDDLLQGRTYTPKDANGTVRVGSPFGLPAPVAGTAATAARTIPWAAVARGASRAVPIAGTAIAVKELYDELRCREKFGGGPECDFGVPPVPSTTYVLAPAYAPNGRISDCSGTMGQIQICINAFFASLGEATGFVCTITGCRRPDGFSLGYLSSQSGLLCPPLGAERPPVGVDGKCPTGEFEDIEYRDLEKRIEDYGTKSRAPAVVQAAEKIGVPFDHDVPAVDAPGVIQGGRETTQLPDGRTITKDREFVTSPRPGGLDWEERVTEREWPAGTMPDAPGVPPGTSTPPGTVVTNPGGGAPSQQPDLECGLPGYPPCKIDEAGTPTFQLPPTPIPDLPAQDAAAREGLAASILGPTFGWMSIPPLAECQSWEFPHGIGTLDPCGTVSMVRSIVGYLWAVVGAWWCLGLIRKTVTGG